MTRSQMIYLGRLLAAAGALLLAFVAAGADESAPVLRPDVKEGDTWSYQFMNLAVKAAKPAIINIRATFVSADAIGTVTRMPDGRDVDSHFTSEWNAMSLASGEVFDRPFRAFKFPLTIGDTYPFVYEVAFRGSPARAKSEGTFKVTGWEDVVVPAGKFRAVKLEGKGVFQRLDTRGGANQRWDLWYVPEVKRLVKSLYEDGLPGRDPDTKRLFELTEFKIQ